MTLTHSDAQFLREARILPDFDQRDYSLADFLADVFRHLTAGQVFVIDPAFWEGR